MTQRKMYRILKETQNRKSKGHKKTGQVVGTIIYDIYHREMI